MSTPRRAARIALALSLLLFAAPAHSIPGWKIEKVAIEGEAAPGTADTFGVFLDVTVDASGRVAFGAPLASGFPNAGVWVDEGSGPVLRMRNGDPAPAPHVGSYLAFGSFVRMDGAGRLATSLVVDTGATGMNGLFLDDGVGDSALVAEGDAAPTPPSGTLDAGLADIGFFGMDSTGAVSFVSELSGGTATPGVFVRSAAGALALRAKSGDLVGGGPASFTDFGPAALNDAGQVVFAADLAGGSAVSGLFLDSGSGPASVALAGDSAPGTGGGTLADFLYPTLNAGGEVAFLSNVAGATVTGGLFVATPAVAPVVVENQVVPGAGPVNLIASVPNLGADGSLALSLGFASGPITGGVYVHDAGSLSPVAVAGEPAPDSGGAEFSQFGLLSRNESGEIAFVATLDDGRSGVFLASPTGPAVVPALPWGVLPVLALLLVGSARGALGRRSTA